jgi:hypothetical protein
MILIPLLSFPTNSPERDFEGGTACAIRARPFTVEKMQLECRLLPRFSVNYDVADNEEIISHFVHIAAKGEPLTFEVSGVGRSQGGSHCAVRESLR